MEAARAKPKGRLLQVLGVAFGVAAIVGNTIGGGILRTPGEVATHLPGTALFLGVWVLGGLYALVGAVSLAELGAMTPRSGGQYVFVRRALGPFPGFVVGWSDWISCAGSAAFVASVFGEYTARLFPTLAGRERALALALLVAFTILLWQGIRVGDAAQRMTTLLKALGLATLAVACLVLPVRSLPSAAEATASTGAGLLAAFVLALQSVIYTYDGWNGVLYFSGEIRDAGRAIPRAMISGVCSVTVIYLLLNLAFVRVIPVERMAGDPFVAGSVARAVFGPVGDVVVNGIVTIGLLSAINAILLMTSRVPYAMAQDGLFPRIATGVSRAGAPRITLFASALVAAAFLLTGTFDQVLALVAFFFVANYTLSFLSVFVLRLREPEAARPYRAWGYPWTPALGLVGSMAFLVGGFVTDRENTLRSLLILALTVPVFLATRLARRTGS